MTVAAEMEEDLLGKLILDEGRVVVDEQDGVLVISGEFKQAQRRAFARQLIEGTQPVPLGRRQGLLDVPRLADPGLAPDVESVVSAIDDASHPVDDCLLLLPVAVKVLPIRLFHRPLLDMRKPGKSENVCSTFRVSGIHEWFEISHPYTRPQPQPVHKPRS